MKGNITLKMASESRLPIDIPTALPMSVWEGWEREGRVWRGGRGGERKGSGRNEEPCFDITTLCKDELVERINEKVNEIPKFGVSLQGEQGAHETERRLRLKVDFVEKLQVGDGEAWGRGVGGLFVCDGEIHALFDREKLLTRVFGVKVLSFRAHTKDGEERSEVGFLILHEMRKVEGRRKEEK